MIQKNGWVSNSKRQRVKATAGELMQAGYWHGQLTNSQIPSYKYQNILILNQNSASNVLTALYAMVAMLKERRAEFETDAAAHGYATPSRDELIYWTYIYYNAGRNAGKGQLAKYAGKRTLGDWITQGEYPNAIKVLETYKASRDIFSGFALTP